MYSWLYDNTYYQLANPQIPMARIKKVCEGLQAFVIITSVANHLQRHCHKPNESVVMNKLQTYV